MIFKEITYKQMEETPIANLDPELLREELSKVANVVWYDTEDSLVFDIETLNICPSFLVTRNIEIFRDTVNQLHLPLCYLNEDYIPEPDFELVACLKDGYSIIFGSAFSAYYAQHIIDFLAEKLDRFPANVNSIGVRDRITYTMTYKRLIHGRFDMAN